MLNVNISCGMIFRLFWKVKFRSRTRREVLCCIHTSAVCTHEQMLFRLWSKCLNGNCMFILHVSTSVAARDLSPGLPNLFGDTKGFFLASSLG